MDPQLQCGLTVGGVSSAKSNSSQRACQLNAWGRRIWSNRRTRGDGASGLIARFGYATIARGAERNDFLEPEITAFVHLDVELLADPVVALKRPCHRHDVAAIAVDACPGGFGDLDTRLRRSRDELNRVLGVDTTA